MIRITQIKISIDEPVSKVKSLVLKKLRLQESDLLDYRIYKESIDARHRGEIDFIYTVDISFFGNRVQFQRVFRAARRGACRRQYFEP